jgi:hypothetical protein
MLTCDSVQEQLLHSEEPARPSAVLQRHLGQCPACRAFRQQLLEMEDGLRRMPVPVSQQRDRLLARLQEGELPTPSLTDTRPSPWRLSLKERAQQKVALALALAATLALFTFGWGFWPHQVPSAAVKRQEHGLLVKAEATPREKVQKVMGFVRRLEGDVLTALARNQADDAEQLSAFFIELVEVDLLERARTLDVVDRAEVIPLLVEQMQRSESRLARACADLASPPEHLRRMATAARLGQNRLRALLA